MAREHVLELGIHARMRIQVELPVHAPGPPVADDGQSDPGRDEKKEPAFPERHRFRYTPGLSNHERIRSRYTSATWDQGDGLRDRRSSGLGRRVPPCDVDRRL